MQLRNKLLLNFAAFVMVTLVAFGLSTYHVVQESTVNNDVELLETLAKLQAADLTRQYQYETSTPELVKNLVSSRTESYMLLLLDPAYNILNLKMGESAAVPNFVKQVISEIRSSKTSSGNFEFEHKSYIWAISKLDTKDLTAVSIYSPSGNTITYRNKLMKRLVAVAVIIFWIAIWGALITATVITRKVTEQQNKIEYQASHDVMTGLQNRNYLTNKIDQIITSKKIPSLSIIIIGINRFREINNTLGHDFGDLLLKELSLRLKTEFWSDDTIARFGSDQYALILPLSDHAHWKIVIDKIEKILGTPFTIQDIHIVSDVSIGVSVFPDHGNTATQLLRCAEVAMYQAKKSGAFFESYSPENDPNSVDRLQLISELNNAIDNNELELHYQPKIDIDGHTLIGCEALLRWNNPNRGRIPPDVFIPLAEQGSIIWNLTAYVLEQAIRQCAEWHKMNKKLSIAVNLSARLLIEDKIVEIVSRILAKYKLSPEFLILEVTESAMMIDPARARSILEKLHNLGLHLSIDDFGTGYTSISQIQNMPVSEIKIDKSFVLNMLNNPGDAMLVKLIIDMAHGMGHLVTAEGIEDLKVLEELKAMGCDIAQGYYLGRPMPLIEFNNFRLIDLEQTLIGISG